MTRFRWLTALLLALVLVAAGCGGDDGGSSSGDGDGEESSTETTEAEPEGQVLIEDDFDDDDNLWNPDDLDIDGEQDLSIDGGAYVVDWQDDALDDLEEGQGLVPNQAWPSVIDGLAGDLVDTRVETEVNLESPGVVGLVCRLADPAPDAEDLRAYFFQVGSTGQVNLAELDEEGVSEALEIVPDLDEDELEDVDELPLEGASFDPEDGGPYELAMTCVDGEDGVEISGFIDGEEVVSAVDDDDPIESGVAGILTSQSRLATEIDGFDAFEIEFESVTITNLGDEIDEDDLEDAADAAEEAAEAPEEEEPTISTGVNPEAINSPALGAPLDPTSVADYGTDTRFDLLASDCYLAIFDACDTLYRETPVGSAYEEYGGTCGGRLEVRIDGDCADAGNFASNPGAYPASGITDFGTDALFDELALACEEGDLEACDELYAQTPVGSGYEEFGATCGARTTELYNGDCISDGN
jgi:hypothetical protein